MKRRREEEILKNKREGEEGKQGILAKMEI